MPELDTSHTFNFRGTLAHRTDRQFHGVVVYGRTCKDGETLAAIVWACVASNIARQLDMLNLCRLKAVALKIMWGAKPPDTEHSLFVTGHLERGVISEQGRSTTPLFPQQQASYVNYVCRL